MALTQADVEETTFGTALRGYDLDEVDDFLDEVIATIRDLEDQIAEARSARPETSESISDEAVVGRVIIAAQTTADTIVADAREESERILEEAKSDAESWAIEGDAKKAEAESEMAELTQHVSSVRTQLAVLATAVADRLDEMDQSIDGSPHEYDASTEDEGADEVSIEEVVNDVGEMETFYLEDESEDEGADDAEDEGAEDPEEEDDDSDDEDD